MSAATTRIGLSTLGTDGGRSGIGRYLLEILSSWASREVDAEVELFVPRKDAAAFGSGAGSLPVPAWTANPLLSIAWHQWGLPGACRRRNFDVLFLPAANRRVSTRAGVPTVGTVHDFSSLHVAGKYDPLRDLYIKRVLPTMVRGLDRVITPSEASRKDIVRYAGVPEDRVHVIPNGVDHRRFHPFPEGEAEERVAREMGIRGPFILYVSRIEHPGKNHLRLIEAFGRMKERTGLPHRLVLAGPDWTRAEKVHSAASASTWNDSIDLAGFIPGSMLPYLTAAADLVAFPSLYEGFGIPVLEAMASGTPVVASSTSSIPEVGGEAVGYFDPCDVGSMESAMTRVLTDDDLHRRMAQVGLDRARGFSWDATAAATMAVLQECAGEAN